VSEASRPVSELRRPPPLPLPFLPLSTLVPAKALGGGALLSCHRKRTCSLMSGPCGAVQETRLLGEALQSGQLCTGAAIESLFRIPSRTWGPSRTLSDQLRLHQSDHAKSGRRASGPASRHFSKTSAWASAATRISSGTEAWTPLISWQLLIRLGSGNWVSTSATL